MKGTKRSHLVDGKYSIKDLVDLKKLGAIFEKYSQVTGSTLGFVSYPDQELLLTAGWRDICTKFHRACPRSLKCCMKSNISMTSKLKKVGQITVEPCEHGLVDGGTPIIIKGKHVATLATGQVFLKKPNFSWFRQRAKLFGYNEKAYLDAVRKVPIVNEKRFKTELSYLGDIALMVAELGYHNIEARQQKAELEREVEERRSVETDLKKANDKYRELARIDSHTGLYNHRYFEEAIQAEFARAKRYGDPLSMIICDIDYFKSINDVYGHLTGDLVLWQLAWELRAVCRPSDIVVRYGGEEFIIVLPHTDRDSALLFARRILDRVHICNFGKPGRIIKMKLSLGLASYPQDEFTRVDAFIEAADQALTRAKETGGNKVCSVQDLKSGQPLVLKDKGPNAKYLKEKLSRLARRANQSIIESIFAFAKAIEMKDHYTGEHVEQSARFAGELARELKLSQEMVESVEEAAMLHDLGKVGVAEHILCKKSKLTSKEFLEIKKHPQIGADILRPIQSLSNLIPMVRYHHERWDGSGYPFGLKSKEIPLGARIVAVAEVYQALISDRPYRKALSRKQALQFMKEGAGTQFDPEIVVAFIRIRSRE